MKDLTPKRIVAELDKYIIGQKDAKRAVSIALRNRFRRQQLPEELRNEVAPKNIIMIGATGIGKTEIARRLAHLSDVPFLKIEVTKFTEVGYVGRDCESMIRDLTNLTINLIREEAVQSVEPEAAEAAEERLLDMLLPTAKYKKKRVELIPGKNLENNEHIEESKKDKIDRIREKLRQQLRDGKLDDKMVELELKETFAPMIEIFAGSGMEGMDMGLSDALSTMLPPKVKKRKLKISEAKRLLLNEESQKLIDMDKITKDAITRVENQGIIFLDEIDKIVGNARGSGPDVSREGVQRDLLPIVEGSTVNTRYGPVKTQHILFIAAGTFHTSKPSDLIPELQGRFPIRVELINLTKDDFKLILTEPKNALIKQYVSLMETEKVRMNFTEDGIDEMASIAYIVNERTENIGARRLHTIIEKVVEQISFDAPEDVTGDIMIDRDYVRKKLENIVKDEDLSRYIL